jgi:minor extracellular serine protease Vpr
VAGIISSPIGVALNVTLGAYRVFGCSGYGAPTDVMIKAYEQAYKDGMQVINLSLGEGPNWPDYPSVIAVQTVADMGIVVCAAMGNDGDSGVFTANTPSIAQDVISVASLDNYWKINNYFSFNKQVISMSLQSF